LAAAGKLAECHLSRGRHIAAVEPDVCLGPITVEGRIPPPGEKFINADVRMVSGHYFQAMEIPVREGRLFSDHDVANKTRVAIVDDYMAQQLWPNQDPIASAFISEYQ